VGFEGLLQRHCVVLCFGSFRSSAEARLVRELEKSFSHWEQYLQPGFRVPLSLTHAMSEARVDV